MEDLPQQDIYVSNERVDVRPFVPHDVGSVIEIGCGAGGFGRTLRSILGEDARIVGVEPVQTQADQARREGCFDEVLDGYFPEVINAAVTPFDLIVFNDVLEHMVDPWSALRAAHDFLSPGGRVLATIPSIQFAPVVWQLIRGHWDYADSGTLDRTHVRFFTRRTMVEMFEGAGFHVDVCAGVNSVAELWRTDPNILRRTLKRAVARLVGDGRYMHFLLIGTSDRLSNVSPTRSS